VVRDLGDEEEVVVAVTNSVDYIQSVFKMVTENQYMLSGEMMSAWMSISMKVNPTYPAATSLGALDVMVMMDIAQNIRMTKLGFAMLGRLS
jgi:hypothetical protein